MITRREWLKNIGILAGSAIFSKNAYTQQEKPNIIFFFVDDMGWQDTSVQFYREQTLLNRRYYTPNMQRLANEGMKFTQAYACAVCSPSRISLMTGYNAAKHQVTNWTLRKNKSPDTPHPKISPPTWNLNGLSPVPNVENTFYATTLPEILQKNGYRTIHAGKAHFGAKETLGNDPLNLGFDINIAGHAAGGPGSYHGNKNFSAAWRNGDRIWDVPGLDEYHGQDIHLTEALTIEANKAIDQAIADKQPFYLYMSHYAIHAPWEKDNRYYQKFIDAGLDEFDATYASMIEGMDTSLGEIMETIERHGVTDNTIIVFMSDNGAPSQADLNRPLRGHKLTPYEGGTRVPMIVKWPGKVKEHSTCEQPVIIEDIFPTFLEMAGVESYQQIAGDIDGISFVPLLNNPNRHQTERTLFWHFPHHYGQTPYSSVLKGDWKLIYHHIDRKFELFNLKDDLSEQNNLADKSKSKLKELTEILSTYLSEVNAPMPIDKQTGNPIEYP